MYFCTSLRSFSGWWISCEPKGAKKMMFAEHYTVCLMTQCTNLQCRSTKRGRKSTSSVVGLVSGLQSRSVSPNRHGTVSALTVCQTNGINTQVRKNAQRQQLEHIVSSNIKDGRNEKHFKSNQVLLHASIAYVDMQQWLIKLQKAEPVSQSKTAGNPNN